jgi:holliday junction DNA helicase RuvA
MIYALQGYVTRKGEGFFVFEVSGVFFRVLANRRMVSALPSTKKAVKVFCAVRFREGGGGQFELYGFLDEESLSLFELLTSVSGVGARTALRILELGVPSRICAAIAEGEASVLARASGVGRRMADRICLELKDKVASIDSARVVGAMKGDQDIEETLVGLGFSRKNVQDVISGLGKSPVGFEDRLREALQKVSR